MMSMNSHPANPVKPVITVIMPVYNGECFIIRSLPPLLEMQHRGEVKSVFVVDDASTDNSAQIAKELGAEVIPVAGSRGGKLGPGAARNQAARLVEGEILWFVDADVVVHNDAVRYLQQGFSSAQVVAVFGAYDDQPAAQNFLSQYKNLVHHFYHSRGRAEASTFWAGCGAVRKQAFLAIGGFDVEKFPRPSIEDIELGYRLRAAGGEIRLLPDLRSTHLKVWKFINLMHTEIFCRAIPWSRLMLESTGMIDDLNVSRSERLRAGLAGIFLLLLLAAVAGWMPIWPLAVSVAVLAWANRRLLALFYQRKGWLFAIQGLVFHQLYYLYSSFAFIFSWLELRIKKLAHAAQ